MKRPPVWISLDPASVLYLRKIAVRKRPIQNVIPLPGFTWQAERKNLPGIDERTVVKNLITAAALSWRAMKGDTEAAFVALVKFTPTAERFHFRMDCPYEKVFEPLADQSARDVVRARMSSAGVDLRHRYALIDELCPMVFVSRTMRGELLITNEFHFDNPMQFLQIDRVGTTSGLLNFIGALNLLISQERFEELNARLPALLKDAMAARADEWLRWIHHLIDEHVLLEPKRLFVDKDNPESYFYDYSGKPI